ncbi:CoA-binding protein [Candidatus Bathyarchaeota archaeon]|nr:CoA-binding protein [Candidatus Bathyarchaeota archaeon]
MSKFRSLFYPNSIAVLGATDNPARIGYVLVKNLREFGYAGRVYPVNPKLSGKELLGYNVYSSVLDIPDNIDLAVIAVSAKASISVLKECALKGVKSAIVLAAGFSESSLEEGKSMEFEIRKISEESGMIIVGPNCLGILSAPKNVCTFPEAEYHGKVGKISAIFQSGSLLASFMSMANIRGAYLNKGVSTGNEAVTTLNDFLEYFVGDPETNVIAMYIEQVRNGKRFIEICRSTTKPLVALKIGKTEIGRLAAKSHTAALAGSIEVWNSVCRYAGIIQANTFEQLYDFSMALASPLKPRGRNVGIVTAPGGPSVIATDMCGEHGLAIPRLSSASIDKLKSMLPPFASMANPIDMTASALEDLSIYHKVLEVVASDQNVDVILVISPLTHHLEIAQTTANIANEIRKPVVVAWTGLLNIVELIKAMRFLGERGIPNYFMPERAVEAIAVMLHQTQLEATKPYAS